MGLLCALVRLMCPDRKRPPSRADAAPVSNVVRSKPSDEAEPGTPGTGEGLCPDCSGSGVLDGRPCPACAGTGIVVQGIGGA